MSAPQAATTLLETVRVRNGVAPLWPLHLERLHRSAAALGIAVGELERPAGGDDRIVRFEVSNGVVRSTEREVGSTAPLALVTAHAVHQGYPHKVAARAWLEAARMPIGSQSTDDVLFFDAEGYLVEASIWAIGWWDRETLVFPPLALGGLPSVARARLAETVRGGDRDGAAPARGDRGDGTAGLQRGARRGPDRRAGPGRGGGQYADAGGRETLLGPPGRLTRRASGAILGVRCRGACSSIG
ncbi:MAG: aminotransferase class IV [Gemmatimonadales bacterium]